MKRPRIALCLLMVIFASSLYAVGFAADRDNLPGDYDSADWSAEEADLCEYAYQGYCEYAYDRPLAAYPYDGCTAGDDDSPSAADYENCQAVPADTDDLESDCIDELEAACLENDELDPAMDDYADADAQAYGYEYSYGDYAADEAPAASYEYGYGNYAADEAAAPVYGVDYGDDYAEDLAENLEPEASDAGSWCGRYCLTRENEPLISEPLPEGAIRKLVERVSDSLVRLLNDSQQSLGLDHVWQVEADALAVDAEDSQSALPLVAAPGWLDGLGWSAANGALAAGMNRTVEVDSLSLLAVDLQLPASESKSVSLRALARPLARLIVELRSGWQQAWSEVSELAAEADEVPEVSSRPEAPAASPPGDAGRDTRTSQRRNPRRVEI